MTTPELLPCPFCGKTVNHETGKRVVCENCSSAGPWKGGKREAISAWNTRAPLSPAPVDALVKAAEKLRAARNAKSAFTGYPSRGDIEAAMNAVDAALAAYRGEKP